MLNLKFAAVIAFAVVPSIASAAPGPATCREMFGASVTAPATVAVSVPVTVSRRLVADARFSGQAPVVFSPREWDAMQAGAVSASGLDPIDSVLWSLTKRFHREHLVLQVFDAENRLILTSDIVQGLLEDIVFDLDFVRAFLEAARAASTPSPAFRSLRLAVTHTHLPASNSAADRRETGTFSADDAATSARIHALVRESGLPIRVYEFNLLQREIDPLDPFSDLFEPFRFSKVGLGFPL